MLILATVFLKALREKDGIPDLRRSARFRYSSVTLPEVGFSILIVVDHSEYRNSTHVIYEHNEVSAISATEVGYQTFLYSHFLWVLVLDSCLRLTVMSNGY
jgi:hypothetical protein